ncbi:hypothetical protein Celaphus_00012912 [Cervus elaphus hippelaphus]|uniref:Uncharacterized protein n=1 Tax=Cervus elaphus hippelaphus TaxID=46360 RepID=A0A212CIB2_CEREH|nr:hypothetical protein Celaphus_00012912 [Cervus elaphus hippelaphus]
MAAGPASATSRCAPRLLPGNGVQQPRPTSWYGLPVARFVSLATAPAVWGSSSPGLIIEALTSTTWMHLTIS